MVKARRIKSPQANTRTTRESKPAKVVKSSQQRTKATSLQKRGELCAITLKSLKVNQAGNTPAYLLPIIDVLFKILCQDLEKQQLDFIHGSIWPSLLDPGSIQRYVSAQVSRSIRSGLTKFASATPAGLKLGLEQLSSPETRSWLEPILRSLMDRDTAAGLGPDRHLNAAVTRSRGEADGRLQLCYKRLTEAQAEDIAAEFRLRLDGPPIKTVNHRATRPLVGSGLYDHGFNYILELKGDEGRSYKLFVVINILPPKVRTLQQIALSDTADKLLAMLIRSQSKLQLLNMMSQTEDLKGFDMTIDNVAAYLGLPRLFAKTLLRELVILYRKYQATNRFNFT